jgi:hypothetical protein
MRQTNPWSAFHSICIFAIVVVIWDVSGISDPRNRAPLPQIETTSNLTGQVTGLLKNLEHLK